MRLAWIQQLDMSRESGQISEESKSEDRDEVVCSASNICLDDRTSDSVHYKEDVCQKSSRLIVDLTETDEDKLFIEQEGESQMVEVRSRKLTEKGRYYQTEVKVKTFKSKKSTFSGTLRKTLLLRGQCNKLPTWKQEFSKAEVLWSELADAYNEIRETAQDEELASIRDIWEQVCGEWSNFERDVRDEIKYLEQAVLESRSVSSKGYKKSKMAKSINSSVDTALSTKVDKYKLQQEEAALKVKLAFVEQEKAVKIEKLVQEQKLEELKLKMELELSRAKLSVCKEIEKEQIPSLEEDDLASLPSESKGDGVSTSTGVAYTSAQSQVSLAPALTTTSTPKSPTCSLRVAAPSFSPAAVTQSVFTVRHFEHGLGLPTQGEVLSSQTVTTTRIDPPVTIPFNGPSPIMSAVITSPSSYQSAHFQSQTNSVSEGWEKVASSLEKCMDKLTEANLEQSTVSKQLFVSGQLPKITIPIFNGDPCNTQFGKVPLML